MQRIAVIGFTGQGGALALQVCRRLRENGYTAEGYAGAAAARRSGLLPAEGEMCIRDRDCIEVVSFVGGG